MFGTLCIYLKRSLWRCNIELVMMTVWWKENALSWTCANNLYIARSLLKYCEDSLIFQVNTIFLLNCHDTITLHTLTIWIWVEPLANVLILESIVCSIFTRPCVTWKQILDVVINFIQPFKILRLSLSYPFGLNCELN